MGTLGVEAIAHMGPGFRAQRLGILGFRVLGIMGLGLIFRLRDYRFGVQGL